MSKILLIGSEGSIGNRYQAIIRYLGHGKDLICFDISLQGEVSFEDYYIGDVTRVIIATPTFSHGAVISAIVDHCGIKKIKQPAILCEKPIAMNSAEVDWLLDKCDDIQMVLQYHQYLYPHAFLDDPKAFTWGQYNVNSKYNFYNTGNDGLYWDLIQVIGLHMGAIQDLKLSNLSPVWDVQLNDEYLSLDRMQAAYSFFLERWLNGARVLTKQQILKMHEKVEEFIIYDKSRNRDTSAIDEFTPPF